MWPIHVSVIAVIGFKVQSTEPQGWKTFLVNHTTLPQGLASFGLRILIPSKQLAVACV
jgi:hypothetical protein